MDVAENLSPAGRFRVACYGATPQKSYGLLCASKAEHYDSRGWGDVHSLEEIAIHEYAHHIHFTEHRRSGKKDAPHGQNFWRIYSALMAKAIEKGLYNDNYINKIIEQEDGE